MRSDPRDAVTGMTPKERLLAAIEGKPVDCIPVSPRIWRYAMSAGRTNLALARDLHFDLFEFGVGALPTPLCDSYCDHMRECLPDVRIECRSSRTGNKTVIDRAFHTPAGPLHDIIVKGEPGTEYGVSPNHEWIEPLVKTPADVERLQHLLPAPSLVERCFQQAHNLERAVGETGLVAYRPTVGVDQIVVDALGVERAMIASIDEPYLLDRLIDVVDQWHMDVMKAVLEDGWKIIFDAWYNFSLSVGWSPEWYRRKVAPLIRRHSDLVHSYGAKMFFYDDGRQARSIEAVVDAGVDIIQTLTPPPAGDLNYRWLARACGGRVCLNGGVDTVRIRFGTPGEIEQCVRQAMETLAPTRRFILGTSDSITEGVPEENIRAFFQTARSAGQEWARQLYA